MIEVRRLTDYEIAATMPMVWNCLNEFKAPGFSDSDRIEYYNEINDGIYIKGLTAWGACDGDTIIGIIATAADNYVSMFFVEGEHRGQGIGKKLLQHLLETLLEKSPALRIVVNSPVKNMPIYRKLGFVQCSVPRIVHGTQAIEMEYVVALEEPVAEESAGDEAYQAHETNDDNVLIEGLDAIRNFNLPDSKVLRFGHNSDQAVLVLENHGTTVSFRCRNIHELSAIYTPKDGRIGRTECRRALLNDKLLVFKAGGYRIVCESVSAE